MLTAGLTLSLGLLGSSLGGMTRTTSLLSGSSQSSNPSLRRHVFPSRPITTLDTTTVAREKNNRAPQDLQFLLRLREVQLDTYIPARPPTTGHNQFPRVHRAVETPESTPERSPSHPRIPHFAYPLLTPRYIPGCRAPRIHKPPCSTRPPICRKTNLMSPVRW
ncbi:hypothetical protein B0H10DRAFT_279576 [Mycena sp. CBHHK59/15]|nr:hypothetical protein B0H10DRAFT_279576 [Mycena sp. CBHHK59/15]